MTSPTRTVAAFDLDGTLARRDTLLPFLCRLRGRTQTTRAVFVHSVVITRALLSGHGRDQAKEAVLARLLRHQELASVERAAAVFAEEVVERRLCRTVLNRVHAHRRAGHELVIVSASPAVYVEPVGRILGFDAVLATRLETGADGRLTGRMEGLNCRGPEKVARLRDWLGDGPVVVYAYGDSAGDRELLALADTAFRLRRGRRLWRRNRSCSGSDVIPDDPRIGVDR